MSGFKISSESLRPEFYQVVLTLSAAQEHILQLTVLITVQ
jgi:hypothetical protein